MNFKNLTVHNIQNIVSPKLIEGEIQGVDYKILFNRLTEEKSPMMFTWLINIGEQHFNYSMGVAHCEIDDNGRCYPTPPKIEDVIEALVYDSYACDVSFSDWCQEYGLDDDRISHKKIYDECVRNGHNLKATGLDLDKVVES